MTIPITLATLANLQNQTTAVNAINSNSTLITTAFSSALNTSGDQMLGNLDMNSNHILNLPAPISADEPVRVVDLETLGSVGTITFNSIPTDGLTGQVLTKHSNSNFDAVWQTPAIPTPPAYVFLELQTPSATPSFNTAVSWTGYRAVDIVFENVVTTGTAPILIAYHSGGGYNFTSYVTQVSSWVSTTMSALTTATTGVPISLAAALTTPGLSGYIRITNIASTTVDKIAYGTATQYVPTTLTPLSYAGIWTGGVTAVDGCNIGTSSGTLSGTFKFYGIV